MTRRLISSLVALAARARACSGAEARDSVAGGEKRPHVPVRTAAVQTRDLDETLALTGTLVPRAQVTVVAEISARLERVLKTKAIALAAVSCSPSSTTPTTACRTIARRPCSTWPRPTAPRHGGEGARRQPAEDRRHHRQGSPLGAGRACRWPRRRMAQARASSRSPRSRSPGPRSRRPSAAGSPKRHADPGAIVGPGTPLYHARGRRGARVPGLGAVGRLRQGEGGRAVDVTVDALPGLPTEGGSTASRRWWMSARGRSRSSVEVPGSAELVGGLFARAHRERGRSAGQHCGAAGGAPARRRRSRRRRRRSSLQTVRPSARRDGRRRGAGRGPGDERPERGRQWWCSIRRARSAPGRRCRSSGATKAGS